MTDVSLQVTQVTLTQVLPTRNGNGNVTSRMSKIRRMVMQLVVFGFRLITGATLQVFPIFSNKRHWLVYGLALFAGFVGKYRKNSFLSSCGLHGLSFKKKLQSTVFWLTVGRKIWPPYRERSLAYLGLTQEVYTVPQEPQRERFRRVFTCSPIV